MCTGGRSGRDQKTRALRKAQCKTQEKSRSSQKKKALNFGLFTMARRIHVPGFFNALFGFSCGERSFGI
jgi:hypothetical protein